MATKQKKLVSKPGAPAPAVTVKPIFNPAAAKAIVPATRHEDTARTVAFQQPGQDGKTDLFSATRVFVATITEEELAVLLTPPASEPVVEPAAETITTTEPTPATAPELPAPTASEPTNS
ncbi:hypothetical protein BH09VER1_BH09VER1_28390 [soil metagenome]